jgi:glycosyltransferase involved in cell wall biosynthesis
MTIDVTVAIRTYNGAKRLPEVLDRLQQQTGTAAICWEVLVVDNNSQDATAAIVATYINHWRTDCRLRYVLEPRQGSSYARDRCVWEAQGDLIGFLDDDNLPALDWVAAAYQFAQSHPRAGAFGSTIHPLLDEPLPADYDQIKHLLAMEDRGSEAFCYPKSSRQVPIGAGCVIRKQAWVECVPDRRRLRGRDDSWQQMVGGSEDVEVMYFIHTSTWETWHNPAMEIWHHLPPQRLETNYLLKVALSSGLSVHACWIAFMPPWQRPLLVPVLTPIYVVFRGLKLALYYLRTSHEFPTNRAKACQFQFRLGRVLSPFVTPLPIPHSNSFNSSDGSTD